MEIKTVNTKKERRKVCILQKKIIYEMIIEHEI